ncbi:transmembrane protein 53-B [Phalaenopsis equestris]|uniref:transmembrane protein 53-B n=1 Tax=Phalaenopsis equestris TaxID=78828 RepID=UPI0009E3E480|nr:transmembrane protein 53-B [Phalaenopsis equestris]XP_020593662.1 transmembrane protein 53-B [Phalaenopsis equestris]
MASFYGNFQRPLSAMAAVVFAAVSSDYIPERFTGLKSSDANSLSVPSSSEMSDSPASAILNLRSSEGLSFLSKAWPPVNSGISRSSDFMFGSSSMFASPPALLDIYHYAKLTNLYKNREFSPRTTYSSSDVLYRWHLPNPNADGMLGKSNCSSAMSQTVVVLLGWLGAKQKHLKRYADWYTSRGFHAVTFTFPMSEIISYKAGGKAEIDVENLANHLADWVEEESGKNLVFHTFSNTGWLIYGVLIEKFQKQDPSVIGKIKGCVVDSAPVAAPDPQVWASGFSAAFLKKQSVAAKVMPDPNISEMGVAMAVNSLEQPKPAVLEVAMLTALEKCFNVVLNLPTINRRLTDVLKVLSTEQPNCPQLYIYSSADRVIPAKCVESFVEKQRRAGHVVRACNFGNSPHVDHFRNHPHLYSSQLTSFFEDCVLPCGEDSS